MIIKNLDGKLLEKINFIAKLEHNLESLVKNHKMF